MPRVRIPRSDDGQAHRLGTGTRKIEPGTGRDMMRSYGVTFETLEGETPEPGDVPVDLAVTPTT